ncbi:MAG: hypothetical protein WA642_11675 [Steroidobacteraceae bacterium]
MLIALALPLLSGAGGEPSPRTTALSRLPPSWRDGEHVMHDYRIVALDRDGVQRGIIDSVHGDWRNLL